MSREIPFHEVSLQEAKTYIDQMDLSEVRRLMVVKENWLEEDTILCEKLYKNYLFLLKKYADKYKIPPSQEIDEFWHNHILDTQRYHEDTYNIFGCYLHHYPYFGMDETSTMKDVDDNFDKNTQELHFREFGEYL